MNNFFFIEDEPEVQQAVEPESQSVKDLRLVVQFGNSNEVSSQSPSFWPFPVVNSVRSAESQDLINKGYTYGT